MNYYHVAKEGYPIGSGDVEAANKVLVTHRLKRSGQHWGRDGGQGYFPFVRYSNLIASKEPSLWSCPEWSDQKNNGITHEAQYGFLKFQHMLVQVVCIRFCDSTTFTFPHLRNFRRISFPPCVRMVRN